MSDVLSNAAIYVIGSGLCYCSLCAPAGVEVAEVERFANTQNPTGISSRWRISDDKTFAGGQPNPCPCDQEPNARTHYLLCC